MNLELPSQLIEPMARAVFGDPKLAAASVNRVMKQHGLTWPVHVVATRHWQPSKRSRIDGLFLLQLHPGQTYVLSNLPAQALIQRLRSRRLVHGSAETAASATGLISAIQRAIIALRQRELEALEQPESSEGTAGAGRARRRRPSLEAEHDVRRLLLHQLRHHDAHWPESAQLWMRLVLARHTRFLNEVRRKITQLLAALCSPVDESAMLGRAFASAMEHLHQIYDYALLPAYLQRTLHELLTHLPGRAAVAVALPRAVDQAMQFIHHHTGEPIGLSQVAAKVKVSPAHLSRQFKQAVGMTLTQYLHQQRVTMACHLLLETQRSVSDIAASTGFGANEHFHRVFKRITGLSPLAYRQSHQP